MNWKILVALLLNSIFIIETLAASLGNHYTYRCDWKSNSGSDSNAFTLMNTPHDHKHLTYKIIGYSTKLSRSAVNDGLAEAFNAWSAVSELTFEKKTSGDVDVTVDFAKYNHNCMGGSFDGPQGVVAHASKYFLHFDDSESWSTGTNSDKVNFYSTAVHEIGHVLGLDHSPVRRAIMFESYNPNSVVMELHSDDIEGIQHLYGAKTTRGNGNGNGNNGGGGVVVTNDCWTTGCQLNTWAEVGCQQYQRVEKSKTSCSGGYKYECCTTAGGSTPPQPRRESGGTNSGGTNSGSWSECWTTGCQLKTWAVVGCGQYGMTQIDRYSCPGGNKYKCCK